MSRRLAYLVIAALAVIGLAANYAATLAHPGGAGWNTLRFVSFFTILTNALVAVAAIGHASGAGRLHDWAVRPGVRTAVTLDIFMVALIFHLLLRNQVQPGALGWWGNLLAHQIVPAAWIGCWLVFGGHGGIGSRAPLRWLIFPLGYAGWTLILGAASGWYPYPFINVPALGYPAVLRMMAIITLTFLAFAYALRWVDGRLAGRLDHAASPRRRPGPPS